MRCFLKKYHLQKKEKLKMSLQLFLSSGDPTRTDDLWVMSPTSYQLLHPAIYLVTFVIIVIADANVGFFLDLANLF